MKKITFCLLVFLAFVGFSFGQDYTVHLENKNVEMPENIQTFTWNDMPENSRANDGYFGWIQFYKTPKQSVQDLFKANSLNLKEYLSSSTYLFYFPSAPSVEFLQEHGVRSITPVAWENKVEHNLLINFIPEYAQENNHILVSLIYNQEFSQEYVLGKLAEHQIAVKGLYANSDFMDLSIPDNCLEDLANEPFVRWLELVVAPDVKDDTRGKSLHRSNSLDFSSAGGPNYTGKGVGVLCRDDGIVGPHIDFQGRIDNSYASGTGQTHGDGVSGIMAGAGNLDPTMRGMAPQANLYVVNYQANFLDVGTTTLTTDGSVQITNSSYSNGCNDGYTGITRIVDLQMNNTPSLLHVFSAGNSNGSNCGYGAGSQWGNITGGHKQGKNVIATANVFFNGNLVSSSSRGPAHDGRIKPEIAANGQNQNSTSENNNYQVFGGTSGAAPGIAGVSAQLYEVYKSKYGGFPKAALIKPTLMNTANDYGNVGPDFKFGFGIVNAKRAAKLIQDGRFLSDNISESETNNHTINIPSGATQIRFMLYWQDVEASAGAAVALINDLDLVVTDPSSNELLPFVLDHTPNATALDTPATNGEDHLNNMEQVVINNPEAGNYQIDVTGFNVPEGPQEYFIVYEVLEEELTLTYPNGGESLVPGESESIHWDAYNTTDNFTIEYSTDNGGSWSLAGSASSSATNFAWNVPSDISGEVKMRITSGSFQDESDNTFSIADQPANVQITEFCLDEASFTWDAVADAEVYDLYLLGEKYMDVVGSSSTNSITVPVANPEDGIWYAVVARNLTERWSSRRTIAKFHNGNTLNCTVNGNDLALTAINNDASDFSGACGSGTEVSVTITNVGSSSQSGFDVEYQVDGGSTVSEAFVGTIASGDQAVFTFSTPLSVSSTGSSTLTASVDLTGDEDSSNDSMDLDFYGQTAAASVPFTEDFTASVPPAEWALVNTQSPTTWEAKTVTGSDGSSTQTAYFDNSSLNNPGEEDVLQTQYFELTGLSDYYLNFDVAKAQYSEFNSDGLRIEISTDCGATFNTVYYKGGMELSSVSSFVTSPDWEPASSDDWMLQEVNLNAYAGETVIFRFINVNGFGNSTYIDNINIDDEQLSVNSPGTVSTQFVMYPNPADNEVFIETSEVLTGNVQVELVNSLGQRVMVMNESAFNGNQARINVSELSTGLYFVRINANGQELTKKLIVK